MNIWNGLLLLGLAEPAGLKDQRLNSAARMQSSAFLLGCFSSLNRQQLSLSAASDGVMQTPTLGWVRSLLQVELSCSSDSSASWLVSCAAKAGRLVPSLMCGACYLSAGVLGKTRQVMCSSLPLAYGADELSVSLLVRTALTREVKSDHEEMVQVPLRPPGAMNWRSPGPSSGGVGAR